VTANVFGRLDEPTPKPSKFFAVLASLDDLIEVPLDAVQLRAENAELRARIALIETERDGWASAAGRALAERDTARGERDTARAIHEGRLR
jgi:hypothetical protein